jgi:hypothetical protein
MTRGVLKTTGPWPSCAIGSGGSLVCAPFPGAGVDQRLAESGVRDVAAGDDAVCAAYGTPIVRCWDFDPVLGATSRTMTLPASIEKVRVSHELYCVLAADGRSFCWGTNLYGAQGDGSYKQGGGDTLEPQQVRTAERFTDLSVGSTNACGLTQEGKVVCWGNNADGVVGQGHLDRVRGPRTVAVLGSK